METWNVGDAYEAYVGRWSRPVARSFLAWLAIVPGSRWIDVGCGTGALTRTIREIAGPATVLGVDASAGYVAFARRGVPGPAVEFGVADARSLPCADASHDAAVSGLVLNFVPEPARMVSEMRRVVRPGGTVAAYVWDYAGEMQLMRRFWDAAIALDDRATDLDEGRRFPICHPDALAALWRAGGLRDVAVTPIDVSTRFRDFDDCWSPFLGGQGPAPGYVMALDPQKRDALREGLRSTLPPGPDGAIELLARAWAVRGRS